MGGYGPRCPIGGEQIDEHSARINATLTCIVLAVALLLPVYRWVLVYLVIDFSIKVFAGFAYSPNCKLAGALATALRLTHQMVDSSPKRLASMIALLMSSAALLATYLLPASPMVASAIIALFLLFAFLEAAFGFCMGCWIYALLPESVSRRFVRRPKAAEQG